MTIKELKEIEHIFQKIWTKAAYKIDYDKKEWQEVEKIIMELKRRINE